MSKIAVIFLSFIVLIQSFNLDLTDAPKIPVLVDHLVTHIQQGESLGEFIIQHYGSDIDIHKNKHKEHQNLPFKHRHLDTHFHLDFIICNNNYPLQLKDEIFVNSRFLYCEQPIKLFETNFFQPPKTV
ncbi:hypothetical protein R3X25_13690 [Lutibacter sp. TH_r2]|uniref:hypothetical protein n=1 Tax=Lutibacter sp. TH_r2 TaxID=3082083 RepID=UPI002953AB2E|nr:hypothetical protein [Lutibacter sp. TH_r2]MDV7188340.1 hypothetical protein [Lutibacter sp. TH_r2]